MKKSAFLVLFFITLTSLFAQSKLKSIASKADNSVFTIHAFDPSGNEIDKGCGFFIDDKGNAMGNAHLLRNASKAKFVMPNGKEIKLTRVVSMDYLTDIALFSFNLKPEEISYYENEYTVPTNNEEVIILKSDDGQKAKIDLGKVKRVVSIEGFGDLTELEQELETSNNGCPVINRDGKLVGVALKRPDNALNFSVNYVGLNKKNKGLTMTSVNDTASGNDNIKVPTLSSFAPIYVSILEQKYDAALTDLNAHLKDLEDPEHRKIVLFLKAYVQKKLKLLGEARDTYTEVLELNVNNEIAYLERARIKVTMGDLESAGKDLEESEASTKSNQALIKKLQADLYYKLDDLNKADQLYVDAQNLGYNEYDLYRERSKIYLRRDAYEKAQELITMAIVANPYDPELYILRGEISAELGKPKDAHKDFTQSAKMGSPDVSGYKVMARTKLKMEDNEGAIKELEEAYKINPEDVDILYLRGQSFNRIESYSEAKTNLDKLLEVDPYNAKAYYERGKTHIALSMMKESLIDMTKAIRLDPDYTAAYLDRGVAYGLIGDFTKALHDFENAVALDPKSEEGYYNLGLANLQIKNRPAACKAWTEASNLGHEASKSRIEEFCGPKNFSRR